MIEAVLFDMDGVLIDSVETAFQARKALLSQYGVDMDAVPDPQGENHRAASVKTLLASVKNHAGIEIDHDIFAQTTREQTRKSLEKFTVDPQLIKFLDELQDHDITRAVVSSGLREGVDMKLGILGIKKYFSVIVTGSEVMTHKPDPEPYLYALRKLALKPASCVVFEDSLTGVQAAQAARCPVIGFTQYNPPKEPLPGVVATVENWRDINYDTLMAICAR